MQKNIFYKILMVISELNGTISKVKKNLFYFVSNRALHTFAIIDSQRIATQRGFRAID